MKTLSPPGELNLLFVIKGFKSKKKKVLQESRRIKNWILPKVIKSGFSVIYVLFLVDVD